MVDDGTATSVGCSAGVVPTMTPLHRLDGEDVSVTVTVSPLVTGDLSTFIDTVSTGRLAALGVQFREKGAPTIT